MTYSYTLFLLMSYTLTLLITMRAGKRWLNLFFYNKLQLGNLKLLSFFHTLVIIIMISPVIFIKQLPVFLLTFPERINFQQTIAFLVCFAAIGFFPWKRFTNDLYDEASSSLAGIALYALSRGAFLIVYEWFFRGMLLMSLAIWLGVSWSIGINILLYTALHLHKSNEEIVGCVVLGLLFCLFTTWWHSIWPAIIFHLQIALVNEGPRLRRFLSTIKQPAL